MQNLFEKYISSISSKFSHEETSEMGYRTDFEILIKGIFESIKVKRIDHDSRAQGGNKPDFVVLNHDVPILYIEAKNIGISLDKVEESEQMARYYGYANLVLTDYLEFRFYRNGIRYEEPIKIANYDLKNRIISLIPENYEHVAKTLIDFTQSHKEPIRSANHLAKIMGGKGQRIRDNVRQFLSSDSDKNEELLRIYQTLKKQLVHDLTEFTFADMYAQTLVYGLFTARFFDETSATFSRQEARDLIPKSNPLLRHFFDHIAGSDFDDRLEYIVNELCEIFMHANIPELMKEYTQDSLWKESNIEQDPVIHFYEDFLKEYDPELRKKMGAYYTPLPVVQFIVRSIDDILKKEFNLTKGLVDTTKNSDGLHKVQILDPAVGTGTFISKVIRNIYESVIKNSQKGAWPAYVQNDLLPRLYGFELMMTPYTIAHLKLSLAFKETGFKYFNNKRLGVYLTNSLEKTPIQQDLFSGLGFSNSIAEEAKEASKIKNEKPIMVVIGNPPYSGVSSNNTEYANNLVNKYKVEPGGKVKLQERKHWLNDDYVKFIALAEQLIEKKGEGIVGYITNHGYLDNPTFRGMRWHLMKTFDSIYVIDLHGNTKKKEISPDGGKDENVFAIQQGVSIMLAIKTGKKKDELSKVYRFDMWGKREGKFIQLNKYSIENIKWNPIEPHLPNLSFVIERSRKLDGDYQKGFSVDEIFVMKGVGVVTARDALTIDLDKDNLWNRILSFSNYSVEEARSIFKLGKDVQSWKVSWAQKDVQASGPNHNRIRRISYRPFDIRYCYYTGKSSGFMARPSSKIMSNFILGENIALVMVKQFKTGNSYNHIFISKNITESTLVSNRTSEIGYSYLLYVYLENNSDKISNLNKKIVEEIERAVGKVSPEDVFDYIYATLYSQSYREKYKDFLKTDFPRIPYPKNKESFKKLVKFGTELRHLHLLESPKVNEFITSFSESGSDIVEKIEYRDKNVYINNNQYFGNILEYVWNFYIGSYQPAQKWLKDRRGKILTNEDIEHYQKMIVSLFETDKIMKKIDEEIKNV